MFATINGARMYFDVEGSGYVANGPGMRKKEALFLLHGGPGSDHSDFKPWLSPLAEHVQLIYVDHRGNGQSERTDFSTYTIEQMADDLDGLRQYLGLDRVSVLGHSFGGMVAQVYASKYQQHLCKLVLVCTAPSVGFWEDAQRFAEKIAKPEQLAVLPQLFQGKITNEAELEKWWELCLSLYFYKHDEQLMHEVGARPIGSLEVSNYMFEHEMPKYDIRHALPGIQTETLIIAARHDWVTPVSQAEVIHQLLPAGKLVVFEQSGHMPFIEEQNDFNELLRQFLLS
ncbi:MAG: alpha/beta fold hydrolase [Clostridia bacterium]